MHVGNEREVNSVGYKEYTQYWHKTESLTKVNILY